MKAGRVKKIILPLSGALILFFIAKILAPIFPGLKLSLNQVSPGGLILSAVFFLAYFYLRALSWHSVLESLNQKTSIKDSLECWFLGECARFIPGNVWSFAGRIYLSDKKKIPASVTLISLTIEALIMISITAVLSLPSIFLNREKWEGNGEILLAIALIVVFIISYFFRKKIHLLLNKFSKIPTSVFFRRSFILAVILQILGWVAFGVGNLLLISNFTTDSLPALFSASILAWLLGYLSIITPMGLGVREGALIALLLPLIPVEQATIVAILSRLLSIISEVLNALVWVLVRQLRSSS